MDHCRNKPCLLHGECISLPDRYECKCAAGYSGNNCEINNGETETWIYNSFTCLDYEWLLNYKLYNLKSSLHLRAAWLNATPGGEKSPVKNSSSAFSDFLTVPGHCGRNCHRCFNSWCEESRKLIKICCLVTAVALWAWNYYKIRWQCQWLQFTVTFMSSHGIIRWLAVNGRDVNKRAAKINFHLALSQQKVL